MGGCANSKYAVDEDNQVKKDKKPFSLRKSKNNKKEEGLSATTNNNNTNNNNSNNNYNNNSLNNAEGVVAQNESEPVVEQQTESQQKHEEVKAEKGKEDIEFIDREEAEKQASSNQGDDSKKEVTTYQTTVVKHTQKEGDELLQHLKDEAFKQLQTSLKQLNTNQNRKTTATSSANNQTPETISQDQNEDLLDQVKQQVLNSLGKQNDKLIVSIIDSGASLIKESKCKNMNELELELINLYPDSADLIKKVINSATGFLTAKGTEAGILLSNILANSSSSNTIQGIMNETEKTTVKVTRTVTEQVLSGGQMKEISKIITREPISSVVDVNQNLDDILKNLSSESKIVKSGQSIVSENTTINENHESLSQQVVEEEEEELASRAEKVVSKAVNAAVEKLIDEKDESKLVVQNGYHEENSLIEENVKIEEESSVKTSTTKILLNSDFEQVQAEFFKNGKQAAEDVVKKLVQDTENLLINEPSASN